MISEITCDAVLQAMGEYDELGADAFLARYGFAAARVYRVAEHGRQYEIGSLFIGLNGDKPATPILGYCWR